MKNKSNKHWIVPAIILVGLLVIIGYQVNQRQTVNPDDLSSEQQNAIWDSYVEAGKAYYLADEYEKAIAEYEKALEIRGDMVVYTSLYTLYKTLEDYEAAESNLVLALEANPVISQNWVELANLERYFLGNDEVKIRAIFEEGLQATTGIVKPHVDVRTNYASYLEDIGDFAGAIEQTEFALQLEKDPARRQVMEDLVAEWQAKL
jgi:tetratricopeptide (TPR) repeat protein